MNASLEQTQRNILRRRTDDIVYYAETAEMFLELLDEANERMLDYMKQLPEDIVISHMQELAASTFNRERANRAYQLVRAAYLTVNPDSIVGEM